ncbi:MAG: hypothetical protein EBY96_06290, partial [Actinobacteria bacterium]|nr:hypothetical protein [Actinomycetota bacterium]
MRSRLFVLFAALCFATTGTSRELGPDSATSLGVALIRFVVGALALWALTQVFAERTARQQETPVRTWILAGAGQALYGATALAIVGISMIVSSDASSDVSTTGILFALCAGLGYAIFALASKKLVETGMPSNAIMTRVFALAALFLSPALFFVDVSWVASSSGVALALWLGVVTVALAYWAYAHGLKQLKPREATMLTLFEPAVATVLGAVVLDERPSTIAWIGIAVVAVAILIETLTADGIRIVPLVEHPHLWHEAARWSFDAWRHEFPH